MNQNQWVDFDELVPGRDEVQNDPGVAIYSAIFRAQNEWNQVSMSDIPILKSKHSGIVG